MIGIIGGTGFYSPKFMEKAREYVEKTRFGEVRVQVGQHQERELAFIPRHGSAHSIPPHMINYRANIKALAQIGAESILATSAVGSLRSSLGPGSLVLPDQFLDFTKSRAGTFFEGGEGVIHTDMTEPYCRRLRQALAESARDQGVALQNGALYVCTEGPRFETAAEIRMFALMGGDLVGMTSVPEVVLSRELGICYASTGIVTNFAAGISSSAINHQEVVTIMKATMSVVRALILDAIGRITLSRDCGCAAVLEEKPLGQAVPEQE